MSFLLGYVLLILCMLGLWWASPPMAFAAFVALSVYNFGERDLPAALMTIRASIRPLW